MKHIKLGLLTVAMLAAVGAYATNIADTYSYEDASGNSISESTYLACPNTGSTLCGQKIDDQTHLVVETRNWDF